MDNVGQPYNIFSGSPLTHQNIHTNHSPFENSHITDNMKFTDKENHITSNNFIRNGSTESATESPFTNNTQRSNYKPFPNYHGRKNINTPIVRIPDSYDPIIEYNKNNSLGVKSQPRNNFDIPPVYSKSEERKNYQHKELGIYGEKSSIYSPIKFWIEDPSTLFQTFDIIPNQDMTDAERLNAMTRVIILLTAIMFVVKFPLWWMFLTIGIITVIILWYIVRERDTFYSDYIHRRTEYLRRPVNKRKPILCPYQNNGPSTHCYKSNIVQSVQTQPLKLISIP